MRIDTRRRSSLHYELANSGMKIKDKYWAKVSTREKKIVSLLVLLSLLCVVGTSVVWGTALINQVVHWVLTYREGGLFFSNWQSPKYTPVTKVYVYNYTNTEEFLSGNATKLKVEEIGPFTYTEVLGKVNVQFHEDGTLSYNEKRVYTFVPEESGASEDDLVVVPNIPLLSAMSRVRDRGFAAQLGLRSALWALNIEKGAFDTVSAKEYMFGYSDRLYDVASKALRVAGNGDLPKLGLLAWRSGVSDNVYTIHTGANNYSLVDVVSRINGKPNLGAWSDPECNRFDAAVGALFYTEPMKTKSRLHLFHVDLCRMMDFEFQKEHLVMGDIPAYRYTPPQEFFQNATANPENACYTDPAYAEWPSGVFLNAPCFSETPIFVSFPRFYQGDAKLRQMVDGIPEPEREKHQFYVDVHPDLGLTVGLALRMQINIMVRKAPFVGDYLDNFEDDTILPNLWFETVIHGFDGVSLRQLWHATYTLRWGETSMQFGLPVVAILAAVLAARRLWVCAQCRPGRLAPSDQVTMRLRPADEEHCA